ncbi:hypothetical protein DYB30_000336 [Aphanomyces astaci]|uniref:AP complex mu/sigma subunit domain-containing protein n=1 Tax=Aphanomyces astaci TaxID=112090 RepID=A0A397DKB9_APHAT|nr:hypothetical protein DYB30_000336 [Aphanomyces astaci]
MIRELRSSREMEVAALMEQRRHLADVQQVRQERKTARYIEQQTMETMDLAKKKIDPFYAAAMKSRAKRQQKAAQAPALINVVIILCHLRRGLDNAGKTTILKKFMGQDISSISPTLGFDIQTLEYKQYKLNVWDVGGQQTIRSYWRNYFEQTDGLVWVVDSADRRRLEDCKRELVALLTQEKLAGATLLIFANKQDLPGALSPEDIVLALGLHESQFANRHWKIHSCSAFTGDGLADGIDWMPDAEQQAVIRDIYTQVSKRSDTLCNFLEGRCLVFVETLDKCFENVCELDLIFHSDKVHYVLDEIVMGGMVLETNINEILTAVNEMNRLDSNSTKRSLPGTGKK